MRPGHSVGQHRSGPDVSDWPAASTTLSLLDGKWVVAVIAALAAGPRRHAALLMSIGSGISDKVLIDTLRRMRSTGLVNRRVIDNEGIAVIYALTPRGYSLREPVAALIHWAHTDSRRPRPPTDPPGDG
jgi:DNA-binding HxlR family transcriptional regulator